MKVKTFMQVCTEQKGCAKCPLRDDDTDTVCRTFMKVDKYITRKSYEGMGYYIMYGILESRLSDI